MSVQLAEETMVITVRMTIRVILTVVILTLRVRRTSLLGTWFTDSSFLGQYLGEDMILRCLDPFEFPQP